MEKFKKIQNYKINAQLDMEKIINEYSGYVYKIIKNITLNNLSEEDIQEIMSDTFFVLWKNTDKLDDEKFMCSYIAGIVKNLVKEKYRNLKFDSSIFEYDGEIVDVFETDMICEEREKMYLIEKSLNKMSKIDRDIFYLYYYCSRKIKEIAIIMNISEFNVKIKLHRIRKKLKNDLNNGGYGYEN